MKPLDKMKGEIYASQIYLVVFASLLVWDWLMLLPLEVAHIHRSKLSPLKACYLLNRYVVLALTSICTALIMGNIPQDICRKTAWIETFTLAYTMVITDCVLMLRVYALFERTRKAAVLLVTLLAFEISALVAASAQTRPLLLPPVITDYLVFPGCLSGQIGRNGSGILWLLSGAPLIVNTLLLAATLYRSWTIRKAIGTTPPIIERLLQGGAQYFVAILIFNLLNCYFWLQPNEVMRSFNVCANIVTTLMPTFDQTYLQASLKSHNASFDSLLRVIPAKYYLRPDSDDEEQTAKPTGPLTKKQKKALKKAKQDEALRAAKSEAARKARLARYDPDEPKTIAEIQAAKAAEKGKGPASSDEDSDGDEDEEQDWQDISQSAEGGEDNEDEDSPNDTDFADSDVEVDGDEELLELNEEGVLAQQKKKEAEGPAPTITELREKLQKRIADIQAKKKQAAGGVASKKKAQSVDGDDDDEEDADEEDGAGSTVKSKDDLLEERKRRAALRDNRRKKRKEQKKLEKSDGAKKRAIEPSNGRAGGGKVNAPTRNEERPKKKARADSPSYDADAALVPYTRQADQSADASTVAFSNLDFTSQSQKVSDSAMTPQQRKQMLKAAGELKKNRHDLPKDANAALEILEKRKQRIEGLDPEKREKAEEKDRWEKVLLKAEGEKVRDDEKRLKKMAKRQEREKKKSAKAWTDRKATVEKSIADKAAKRNSNLAARAKAAKDKKAGIKAKSTSTKKKTSSKSFSSRSKGRPGFEGGGRKK
ncbi:hypothetical protein JCM3766R1_004380 [Sporobolomyces carnicolor]